MRSRVLGSRESSYQLLVAVLATGVGLLSACQPNVDIGRVAESAVVARQQLLEGQLEVAYLEASPEFRESMSKEECSKLFALIKDRLGSHMASRLEAWNSTSGTDGNFMNVEYVSRFEKGEALETFVWKLVDGRPQLAGYHIRSKALGEGS